ncbi:MAG: Crp/Fnr family transcriptional regulator [Bacteroidales bacterium]
MDWDVKPSVDFLRDVSLFRGLPHQALANLAARARIVRLAPHQYLFHKGDPGDALYIVLHGGIQIGVVAQDGRQVSFAQLHPGQLFGEIAVFDNGPRTADALAVGESAVLCLGQKDILACLADHPAHAMHMIGTLCQRIRNADQLIEDFLFMSLPARVAKHLLALCDMQGHPGFPSTLRISQQDLADRMAVSRESVNRLLSKWDAAKVVALSRGHVTILSRRALEDYAAE